jgi:hypothetical protein
LPNDTARALSGAPTLLPSVRFAPDPGANVSRWTVQSQHDKKREPESGESVMVLLELTCLVAVASTLTFLLGVKPRGD